MNLDAPTELPVNLSHSSIQQYLECPEKWRRKYIEHKREAPVGVQILGRAVHQAESQSYHTMVETGQPNTLEQVLDDFSTSLDNEEEAEEIDWQDDTKGSLKDRGSAMLASYHKTIVPAMLPEVVEHKFNIRLRPEYKWTLTGYIDVIGGYNNGVLILPSGPHDIKTVRKAQSQQDIDASIQGTLYTYATMGTADEYKTFFVHELKVLKGGASSTIIETTRSKEAQLLYLERVAKIAREIDWRMSSGEWQGAPPNSWWCRAKSCTFFSSCPMATR